MKLFKILKRSIVSIFIISILISGISGCAAIFSGTSDRVGFNSSPKGASVYVNGKLVGKAPLKMKLKKNQTYYVEFKREGYTSCGYYINNEIGVGWVILDIFCGLIPVAIDAITGSWYYLEPDYLNCNMEKEGI